MKKFLIALMVLLLALTIVACGGTPDISGDDQTDPPEEHVHAYSEETLPSTCLEAGKIVTKCACGDVQSETALPLADHTASALDCEVDTTCTVCGIVLAEKTGHVVLSKEIVTAATCTSTGKEKGVCLNCAKIVENEIPTAAHTIASANAWTLVDGAYGGATCSTCNQAVFLKEVDVLLNLTFEEDIESEIAKYPAFVVNKSAVSIATDVDGDKAHLNNSPGKVLYLGIADRAKLISTGYYSISFDFTPTGAGNAETNGGEASMLTLMPGFYGAEKTAGPVQYAWYFKYNVHLKKLELVKAGTDATKLDATNSYAIEQNKTYKVNIIADVAAKANYVFVNGTFLGKASMNKSVIDLTDAVYDKNVSFRLGDSGTPDPLFDNFKVVTLK